MAHGRNISVVGLGYIGLPVAVAFGKRSRVVGFDLDAGRIEELRRCVDRTREIEPADLAETDICFTSNAAELREADFHIVAAPTPIDRTKKPDLRSLLGAARTVGRHLKPGDIVVFESTVYPGVTEEDCVPVLEDASGLVCGTGFTVGYSPERINPGDREHTFTRIAKIVAGQDEATLDIVASVYESVVTAGVYRAATIRVAEAAKVIENTQRDLDIALMNELALIFARRASIPATCSQRPAPGGISFPSLPASWADTASASPPITWRTRRRCRATNRRSSSRVDVSTTAWGPGWSGRPSRPWSA